MIFDQSGEFSSPYAIDAEIRSLGAAPSARTVRRISAIQTGGFTQEVADYTDNKKIELIVAAVAIVGFVILIATR